LAKFLILRLAGFGILFFYENAIFEMDPYNIYFLALFNSFVLVMLHAYFKMHQRLKELMTQYGYAIVMFILIGAVAVPETFIILSKPIGFAIDVVVILVSSLTISKK
jgi:hypothetical protein